MDPYQNGYLAPYLYPHFLYNFYQPPSFAEMGYNYSDQVPFSNSQPAFSQNEPRELNQQALVERQGKQNMKAPMLQSKKRPTKRLSLVIVQENIQKNSQDQEFSPNSLNYFYPWRAPVITTLRNRFELEADYKNYCDNLKCSKDGKVFYSDSDNEGFIKLKLLDTIPCCKDYPFLVCKRRKYYRNMKRRYSVSFLRKRAEYIKNRVPIPLQFQPKHKNRSRKLSSESSLSERIVESDSNSSYSDKSVFSSGNIPSQIFEQKPQKPFKKKSISKKNINRDLPLELKRK